MGSDQKRALLAVVLSGLILFGWQYFFAPATSTQVGSGQEVAAESNEQASLGKSLDEANKSDLSALSGEAAPAEVTSVTLQNNKNLYTINSQLVVTQGVFKETNSELTDFFSPLGNGIQFLRGDVYRNLNFSFEKISDHEARFANNEAGVNGSIVLTEKGFLDYKISSNEAKGFRFVFKEKVEEGESGGMLPMQAGSSHKQFGYFTEDYNTLALDSSERGEAQFRWFSVDNDYHIFGYVLDEKAPLLYNTNEQGRMVVSSPEAKSEIQFKQIFARKEYDQLGALGYNLDKSIDFGIWGVIAVPILRGLQFFYSVFPNYGISIILLTIIIRMLTFPLQFKSFKSMKKMQQIQPELAKLKEKFKNDPQRMQQETMALFKRAGANPLGGCLPMILQMPVFFAFYKVLYSSVELVDAPFYGWIHDLSQKDPYYVLPVLMGLAMVLNQKLMPSTVSDPVQKKVMLFMPLIFAVFMKDFPAGLTLYIFVSTLMGMGQQLFVYKRT